MKKQEIKVRICDMIYFKPHDNDLYSKNTELGMLQFISGGSISAPINWNHKRRFLEQYELIYLKHGTLYLNISDKEYVLNENQLMLIPQYHTIRGSRASENEVMFYWVDFGTHNADSLSIPPMLKQITVANKSEISTMFYIMNKTLTMKISDPDVLESLVLLILYTAKQSTINSQENKLVIKIKEYIENHFSEPLTAADIAKSTNYHKDYVNRVFSRATGIPLKSYVNARKMDAAKTLLRTSEYTIQEISEQLGYSDSNLFTKFFHYHQEVTPTDYRNGFEH